MARLSFSSLLAALPPSSVICSNVESHGEVFVEQLDFRADACRPGSLFIAWKGARSDGHDAIDEAIACGAVAVVGDRPLPGLSVPWAQVAQPRQTLGWLGQALYSRPADGLELVAITGTSGKTTCAHLVAAILAEARGQAGMVGTLGHAVTSRERFAPEGPLWGAGSALTTPEGSALAEIMASWRRQGVSAGVLEASSIALAQGRLAGVAFDVALMTNFSREHLDVHGDMATYLAAKKLLFSEHLKPSGTAVLNADDPHQDGIDAPTTLRFSRHPPHLQRRSADVFARTCQLSTAGIDAMVATPCGDWPITSPLMGPFNVENILAAVAVGCALNVALCDIARALSKVGGVAGRLQRVISPHRVGGPLVLVDYAHKPDALSQALAAARALCRGQLWCVFGCGGDRDAGKRQEMGRLAAQSCEVVLVTNDNPRTERPEQIAAAIVEGLEAGGARVSQALCPLSDTRPVFAVVLDRAAAIALAVSQAGPDDVVVIAGKGHETYQEVEGQKRPFDDRKVAEAALMARADRAL